MRAASAATLTWLRAALQESPPSHPSRKLSSACIRLRPTRAALSPMPCPRRGSRAYTTTSVQRNKNLREEPMKQASRNYYDLFPDTIPNGAPPKGHFTIDLRQLRREFLRLQAQAHPDLAPEAERPQAQALSAHINEAYKTLQHPLLRAQYLLADRGIDVAADEAAKIEDEELLMEVMEVREEIESAESEEEVEELRQSNERRIQNCVQVLEEAFKTEDLETAKNECVKLRYWVNVRDALHAWEKGKRVEIIH